VPGSTKSHVKLNIRVSDWNGQVGSELHYQMQVHEAGEPSVVTKAAGQQTAREL
jgi:hypothetical protein